MTSGERMVWAAAFAVKHVALQGPEPACTMLACVYADQAVHTLRLSGYGPGRAEMVESSDAPPARP